MTPAPGNLFSLSGQIFELLEAREEIALDPERSEELAAIESGIVAFVANKLREVDDLRAPLKALEQAVALNKADAKAAEGRAIVLQNRYDRLKDLIKQCMIALDQAGEWKPKETRKFESARGSFTLRGNGGAQPVEITDESLVPEEYKRVRVTMSNRDLTFVLNLLLKAEEAGHKLPDGFVMGPAEISKSAIAEALNQPCPHCGGKTVDPDGVTLYHCQECGGTNRKGVPGARLGERGESVVVK